jgi:predicted phosphate transport protein (TIGR00153 family)
MRLRILPKRDKFFDLFEEVSKNIVKAAESLKDLAYNFDLLKEKADQITEAEHEGDRITHQILSDLNTTFITPIDHEDIYELAINLDDVIDLIKGVSERILFYKISQPTQGAIKFSDIVLKSAQELDNIISLLRKFDKKLHIHCVELHRLENEADVILHESIAEVFETHDPIEVIKWKEIYDTLELITDKCEDIADMIESIVMKHA